MGILRQKARDILLGSNREQRLYLCWREPLYFGVYHFPEFFSYPPAPFHHDFCEDWKKLIKGEIDEAAWVAFRESAKTSWAKILLTHTIVHANRRFINYDSYDKNNSEAALFDIANWLQTKETILQDYGQLFSKQKKDEAGETQKLRRISKFITSNGVMVQAFSTQEPVRGRVFNHLRPDCLVFDDIETNKTKESRVIISKIVDHVDEARTGMAPNGLILYLGNLILDDGVVAHVLERLGRKARAVARNIPVVYPDGTLAWPGKYVHTNRFAVETNRTIMEPTKQKISLEQKRADLGDAVFETEMMNNPAKSGDLFFDRDKVLEALKNVRPPTDEFGGMALWAKYNPLHRYGMGADTAEGIGADSSTSALIDFTAKPNHLAGIFDDNQISPTVFAGHLKRQANHFGGVFIVPEINNTGYATVAELVNQEYTSMYQREVKNKTSGVLMKEYGWRTTIGTKFELIGQLKEAFESGELLVWDKGLLVEMYHFRKQDARLLKPEPGVTRHFDKLMAAALAWEARKWAPLPKEERKEKYRSPHHGQAYVP